MTDYLLELNELRDMLKFLLNKELLQELVSLAEQIDHSYVDSYKRISDNSEHGTNCGYAAKAKDLFVKLQERPISEKIAHIFKTYIEPTME